MPLPKTGLPVNFSDTNNTGNNSNDQDGTTMAQNAIAPQKVQARKEAPKALAASLESRSSKQGATIIVVDKDNRSEISHITNKFFLSSLNYQYKEKAQLVETFGTSSVSFFDDSVKVYRMSGQAVDYPSDTNTPHESMHQSSLIQLYNKHMRGTELVKNNQIAVLKVMNHLIYGYPLNMSSTYNASQDKIANFSMSWVISRHSLSMPGSFDEDDIATLYSPDRLDSEVRAKINEALKIITNLSKFNFEAEEAPLGFIKFDIINDIPQFSGVSSSFRVNQFFKTQLLKEEKIIELKDNIKTQIKALIDYIREQPPGGIFSTASNKASMFTNTSLDETENALEGMFKKDNKLNKVIEFLISIDAARNKLFATKTSFA